MLATNVFFICRGYKLYRVVQKSSQDNNAKYFYRKLFVTIACNRSIVLRCILICYLPFEAFNTDYNK